MKKPMFWKDAIMGGTAIAGGILLYRANHPIFSGLCIFGAGYVFGCVVYASVAYSKTEKFINECENVLKNLPSKKKEDSNDKTL